MPCITNKQHAIQHHKPSPITMTESSNNFFRMPFHNATLFT